MVVKRLVNTVANSQYHLAVAGGCVAIADCDWNVSLVLDDRQRLRTHPLPRGGTDCLPLRRVRAH
jgi:hypothetical protein